MTVTVKREHAINGIFVHPKGCPLYLAIKDQYPDFQFAGVGGFGRVAIDKFNYLTFRNSEGKLWNFHMYDELNRGVVEEIVLTGRDEDNDIETEPRIGDVQDYI